MPYRRRRRSAAGIGMAALLAMGLGWGQTPERAAATQSADSWELENGAIKASVRVAEGRLGGITIQDRGQGREVALERPFEVLMKDGRTFGIGNLKIAAPPNLRDLPPHPEASRMAQRLHGEELDVTLESEDHLRVAWSLILLDGSNYIRQVVTITAAEADVPIERVQLVDLALADAHVAGTVDGSPIVAGRLFLGFEHPLSKARVTEGRATAWIDRELPLRAGQSVSYSAVMGVARQGQMRRDFLSYLETERAHPYRTFLHYNSWYDLGYFNPYDQQGAVDRLNFFGRELVEKRGVQMDSSLFDDGWDDHASLWKFNSGFPEGFTPVKAAAEKYGAEPGVWMSPWGGYSKPKQERIAFGKSAGYEIVAGGYALSGPRYYSAFRDVCLEMMRKYGVNQFKFDGTGNVNSVVPGSQFDSDFAAAIHLIGELREAKPDLFVNLTTGTWPSPFWLL